MSTTTYPRTGATAAPSTGASNSGALLRLLVSRGLPLLVGLLILTPLLMLLANTVNVAAAGQPYRFGTDNWSLALSDSTAFGALVNSFTLAATRTVISVPLAILIAWLIARTNMPGRGFVELLAWVSIFMPVLPLTFGWVLLLDPKFGLLNTWIKALTGVPGPFDIYGFWGITWVHLASTSVGFKVVLLTPAFRRVGAAIEQAARVCGANAWQTITRITLPLLAPIILLVTVQALILGFESFEIELLLGEPVHLYVYATRIYDLVNNQPSNVGEATVLAVVFLVWLLLLNGLYRWAISGRNYSTVTGREYVSKPTDLKQWRWVALFGCLALYAASLLMPFIMLITGSFMRLYGFFNVPNAYSTRHWEALFGDPAFGTGLRNSLIIATSAAIVSILLYSMVAYALTRYRSPILKAVDVMVWTPWAVPGVLTSLSLLWLFLSTPLRSVLYGTVAGIAVAFVFRASPLSTQTFRTTLMQIGPEVEEAARTCGASWLRMYFRIALPLLAPAAVTVGLLTFLSSLYEISTPVLLYSAQSRPLSILMLEYGFSGARERASAIGVVITLMVLVVLIAARSFGFRMARERV